ncbi:MAG TPA: translation initiation factor IF-5A [Candidatus Nanoarchaeia archaeon]|nr:translation initiation factor IF-5A [Candidatus Nanoarchaeia archaeon]
MVLKIINATEAKSGANIIIDGMPCTVRSMDVSKTGKHGHSKCRFEAIGMINGQKKVFVLPGHDRLEVPLVEKKRGQVLSKADGKVNLMDLESFETIEVPCPDKEVFEELEENSNCEYWNIEGERIVKRKL